MNYHHSRRILTVDESSRKTKDRQDTFYSSSPPRPLNPLTAVSNVSVTTSFGKPSDPNPNNNSKMPNPILAGYMAYEFLTKGTLMGQKFDPAKAVPANNALAEPPTKKRKSSPEEDELAKNGKSKLKPKTKEGSYAELACLLRSGGTHIPGIVNPTQLAQWIQM